MAPADIDRSTRLAAAGLVTVGVALVVASGFLVWLAVLGSELTGYRLAELLTDFGGELAGIPPRWVGAAWYLFPAAAAVCWLLVFWRAPASASTVHVPMGFAIAIGAAGYLGFVDVQPGPVLACVGGAIVATGGMVAPREEPR